MKVGIISEYTPATLNYGNILQTYALNHYIGNMRGSFDVETIILSFSNNITLRTKKLSVGMTVDKVLKRLQRKLKTRAFPSKTERLYEFTKFAEKYIPRSGKAYKYCELNETPYDIFVVGSDVVWNQYSCGINRAKFLDFEGKKSIKRVAYAASFGRNWIPEENKTELKRCLDRFDAISVREKSAVSLLDSVGIENACHCIDPTLLLSASEWEQIEEKPGELGNEDFAFVYLLSEDRDKYEYVERYCRSKNLVTVTIPFASGEYIGNGGVIGDIKISSCSPQNWIWLIHHSEYVFTDSFHGTAFSTIFKKRFFVLERVSGGWGIRLLDFLNTIDRRDLFITDENYLINADFTWDYCDMEKRIKELKDKSMLFLDNAL